MTESTASNDLPREPTGKLLKRKLRDEYRARLFDPTHPTHKAGVTT